MPPLGLHLAVVKEAAAQLQHPVVDRYMGSYAIGATLPDIQIVTSLRREETHFFDLDREEYQSGTERIFEAHPELAQTAGLDDDVKSLVAGYLSHLITDEIWILDVYRPLFGKSSPLGENAMANMMDKLVQYELDRRERENRTAMEAIRASVREWEPIDPLGLVDKQVMTQWRDFVCSAAIREPNLALFPLFARRYLLHRMEVDETQLDEFFSSMEASLEWIIEYVTPERLAAYREKAIAQSAALAAEYLNENR